MQRPLLAFRRKPWFARRATQIGILLLFLPGLWSGIWIRCWRQSLVVQRLFGQPFGQVLIRSDPNVFLRCCHAPLGERIDWRGHRQWSFYAVVGGRVLQLGARSTWSPDAAWDARRLQIDRHRPNKQLALWLILARCCWLRRAHRPCGLGGGQPGLDDAARHHFRRRCR